MKSQATPNAVLREQIENRKANRNVALFITLFIFHSVIAEGIIKAFEFIATFF